jgi:hypothetical protein
MVYLEVGGQTQTSTIKRDDVSPVWDEHFTFTMAGLRASDLEVAHVRVAVHNATALGGFKGSLLGERGQKGDGEGGEGGLLDERGRQGACELSVYVGKGERVGWGGFLFTRTTPNHLSPPLLGEYLMDLLDVYVQPNHQLWRRWVALTDPRNARERGVQGMLQLCVTVLGPGDVMHIPPPSGGG